MMSYSNSLLSGRAGSLINRTVTVHRLMDVDRHVRSFIHSDLRKDRTHAATSRKVRFDANRTNALVCLGNREAVDMMARFTRPPRRGS